MVAGLQHAVQCLELPCYRRALLWLQACTTAVQSFPTAACRSMGVQPVSHSRLSLQPGSTSAEPQTAHASSPPSPPSSLLSLAGSL